MLELLFIVGVIWIILTCFYKQAIHEFRINQLEWPHVTDTLSELMRERTPLILRGTPSMQLWTREDVRARPIYASLPIFQEVSLVDWIHTAPPTSPCPWNEPIAEQIARVSGLSVWAEKNMHTAVLSHPLTRLWIRPSYGCWAGERGLFRTFAQWTLLLPVDGAIRVTILPESMETYLPPHWRGGHPERWSRSDTPFVGELKYIDVIVRPGTCLMMPPHWYVSWTGHESSSLPMVCVMSYHSPVSRMAQMLSPNRPDRA